MWDILFHHPWVRIYLVIVGFLSLAVIWDRLRQPPPLQKTSRPGEGRSMTPQGVEEKPRIQGSGRSAKPLSPPAARKTGLSDAKTGAAAG
jgi:hypothetical protein